MIAAPGGGFTGCTIEIFRISLVQFLILNTFVKAINLVFNEQSATRCFANSSTRFNRF